MAKMFFQLRKYHLLIWKIFSMRFHNKVFQQRPHLVVNDINKEFPINFSDPPKCISWIFFLSFR